MILPFVREVLADVEKSAAFQQAAPYIHQRRGESASPAGRICLSGLVPGAKALLLPYLRRAAGVPLIVVTADNAAADSLFQAVQAFCELTAVCAPEAVVKLPGCDVLPFENLSPHPEIQEERATALWKIAGRAAEIVIAPVEAACMRLRPAEHYASLARVVRRADLLDLDELTQHLNTVGYTAVEMVEMPGEYAVRGGLFDIYPPETGFPVRLELFGDEVESIRKFDPGTQRSAGPVDEVSLLPLTETPVREEVLAEVHARLSGARVEGEEESIRNSLAATGVAVFPGWEFYANAGSRKILFDLLPGAVVFMDEPSAVQDVHERWWNKVCEMHERSLVGKLATPEDIYVAPEEWNEFLAMLPGGSLERLGVLSLPEPPPDSRPDEGSGKPSAGMVGPDIATAAPDANPADHVASLAGTIDFHSRPATRFHGSVPAMVEEIKRLTGEGQRVIFSVPTSGEMERLADIFTEYQTPFRFGSRSPAPGGETYLEETAYVSEERAATIVRSSIPEGMALPGSRLAFFGARDLFDDSDPVVQRPERQRSKTSTFMSDFRDLAMGDYVVHVEHGIAMYQGLKEIQQGDVTGEYMVLEFAEAAKLYVPLTRLDLIQKFRSSEGAKPALSRLGGAAWAKTKARVKKAMKDMAD